MHRVPAEDQLKRCERLENILILSIDRILHESRHEKTCFCICENKGADQLCGKRTADQHLCFRSIDSTIPLLPKSKISSL